MKSTTKGLTIKPDDDGISRVKVSTKFVYKALHEDGSIDVEICHIDPSTSKIVQIWNRTIKPGDDLLVIKEFEFEI